MLPLVLPLGLPEALVLPEGLLLLELEVLPELEVLLVDFGLGSRFGGRRSQSDTGASKHDSDG
ncbi:MAG: hypothetical protein ACR2J1_05855 [Methyloceanibacter sp.]|uniref:hypothetical protein n=1 Tax=Methyloceanibacter sp. TaxID=1965321 RepID=UPI003D9B0763